jgi:hypothetical protein
MDTAPQSKEDTESLSLLNSWNGLLAGDGYVIPALIFCPVILVAELGNSRASKRGRVSERGLTRPRVALEKIGYT